MAKAWARGARESTVKMLALTTTTSVSEVCVAAAALGDGVASALANPAAVRRMNDLRFGWLLRVDMRR